MRKPSNMSGLNSQFKSKFNYVAQFVTVLVLNLEKVS